MLSSLRPSVHRWVQRALAHWGYKLQRVAPLDLRSADSSPWELLSNHSAALHRSLLIDVPISRCRSALGVALDERHPFVATLVEEGGGYEGSHLEAYYAQCQPRSAAEALGVSDEEAPGFAEASAWAYVVPWVDRSPEVILQKRSQWMKEHAARYGYELDLEDGSTLFGPVSIGKGRLEIERLEGIAASMSHNGFLRRDEADGDIVGELLTEKRGNWCVRVVSGQHRIAVAAALGLSSVPVRVEQSPVKREDVAYWPQVVGGRVTEEGALAVFDRIMRGDSPSACLFSVRAQAVPVLAPTF